MATNERVTDRCADFGTLICRFAECLQESPTGGCCLYSDPISTHYIFTIYDLARGITSIVQKRSNPLDKLREI